MHENIQAKPIRARCRKGHRLVAGNIYWRRDGHARCRECMLEADKRYRERKAALHG